MTDTSELQEDAVEIVLPVEKFRPPERAWTTLKEAYSNVIRRLFHEKLKLVDVSLAYRKGVNDEYVYSCKIIVADMDIEDEGQANIELAQERAKRALREYEQSVIDAAQTRDARIEQLEKARSGESGVEINGSAFEPDDLILKEVPEERLSNPEPTGEMQGIDAQRGRLMKDAGSNKLPDALAERLSYAFREFVVAHSGPLTDSECRDLCRTMRRAIDEAEKALPGDLFEE